MLNDHQTEAKGRNTWKIIQYVITCLIIAALILYIVKNRDRISIIFSFDWTMVASLAALAFLAILARGVLNRVYYGTLCTGLTLVESIGLGALNTVGNLLPLSGGLMAKGTYIRRKHDLPMTVYLSSTAALFVIMLSVHGLLGLCTMFLINAFMNQGDYPLWLAAVFLAMLMSFFTLFIDRKHVSRSGRLLKLFMKLEQGWKVLRRNKHLLLEVIPLQVLTVIIIAIRLSILFKFFSYNISILHCIIFVSASLLTRIINITPGGIGVREGIIAGLSTITGVDFGIGILVVAMDRIILISMSLLSTGFLLLKGRNSDRNPI